MSISNDSNLKHLKIGGKFQGDTLNWTQIGDRIKKRRESLRITQSELGKQLNITKQAVSVYEAGNSKEGPSIALPKIATIAKYLKCSIEYLLCLVDHPNNLLITNSGCRIYPESLGFLSSEDQKLIQYEHTSALNEGLFPSYQDQKWVDHRDDYELVPLTEENLSLIPSLNTEKVDSFFPTAETFYLGNVEKEIIFCFKNQTGKKDFTGYYVKNPTFHYSFPPVCEEYYSPLSSEHKQGAVMDYQILMNLVFFATSNKNFSACFKKAMEILGVSIINKNDEYDKLLYSFLENYAKYENSRELVHIFLDILTTLPKNKLQKFKEKLCDVANSL